MQRNRIINENINTLKLKLSIDFIRFSINSRHYNNIEFFNLFNEIRARSVASSEYRFKVGIGYTETKKYIISLNNRSYEIIASRSPLESFKPVLLTIQEPDEQVLQHLKPYLNQMLYHVNSIEFTLDFISNVPTQVYQFMKSHLLLKWSGKKIFNLSYATTFYRNDIRKTKGKGLRCYLKDVIDTNEELVESVRVELLIKRPLFKKKFIGSIDDVLKMDNKIALNYLSLKDFNFNKFINRLKEKKYDQQQINDIVNQFKQDIKNGYLYELNDIALDYSKKYDSDCYLERHVFHKHFFDSVNQLSFINGDSCVLDIGKMK